MEEPDMKLHYNINDIDEQYIQLLIEDFKDKFEHLKQSIKLVSRTTAVQLKSITAYNPVLEERKDFEFSLAYHFYMMYYFVTSQKKDIDVEESIARVEQLVLENPFFSTYGYKVNKTSFYNSREGFLLYLTDLKTKLLSGENFTAAELGAMIGITGEAVAHRIKNETLKAKKRRGMFVIKNNEARRAILESKSPLLKRNNDFKSNKKEKMKEIEWE